MSESTTPKLNFISDSTGATIAPVDGTFGLYVSLSQYADQKTTVIDATVTNEVVLPVYSKTMVFNGTTWDRMRGDITNGVDVDVTRVIPGTTATALGKAEDSAHTDGDTGVLFLGVRNHYSGSSTDGDYSAISVDSTGNMNTIARCDLVRLQTAISFTGNPPTAYAVGDQFGALVTLTSAARVSGGTGTITGVAIQSGSDVVGAFDVVFFESSVTLAADSAAFSISDADGLKVLGIVPLVGAYDLGSNRLAQAFNLAMPYVCTGSTSLYAGIIARSAFTLVISDFTSNLSVFVERN